MARFSLFRTPKPQQYNYVPRYYDPDKEDLERRVREATPADRKGGDYSVDEMKGRIQSGLRGRKSIDRKFHRRQRKSANYRVVVIAIALTVLVYFIIRANLDAILSYMG